MDGADGKESREGNYLDKVEEEMDRGKHYDFKAEYLEAREKSCRVNQVVVRGNDRTKPNTILQEFQGVSKAGTLEQIKDELLEVSACLAELDIFREVDILVDAGPEENSELADLYVTVAEKNIASFSTGTYIQGGEGSVEATISLRNLLGHAEVFQGNASFGSQKSNAYALGVRRPRWGGIDTEVNAQAFQSSRSHEKLSSYVEWMRGVSLGMKIGGGNHGFNYEAALREIQIASPRVSEEVRKQGGHSFKSGVGYTFMYDQRDHPIRPTNGAAAQGKLDLTGLGIGPGVEKYLRQQVKWQVCRPLVEPFVLDVRGQWGVLLPLGQGWDKPTCISERFFLGGPGSLRGFAVNGAGPMGDRKFGTREVVPLGQQATDALGGDLMCSLITSLTFDLPNKLMKTVGIHGHVFLNGGNVVPLLNCGPRTFLEGFRWSAGFGLVLPTRVGRLEVNYCHVLKQGAKDEAKRGIQFGFDCNYI
uniref:Bacterial surface antigen (D15) domain-containing protein n=1 Tax=Picocystis salinarum TaxID=88271 RepID=A0A6U9QFE8_9CHLO|mmetsp:Transcript_6331/g.39486  ORF Transcript_6331/g.39486 Transcript_6331/m.39486 type:complete len:476 (+) Transcript_6331:1899-3326(+)|eukprot:CAMPEP_0183831780 /NCGR_PEP_ID=MMETSP0807_2-20130328/4984_1 /TAXON_ID=88271 /ORGANISM="Picocystis salinarum, Strain CCMP1897" /LENGTH=475 /DNA_ID=CAMNT_0026077383 /DNA_START=61 /DNA_END=1488 /DNA_ORIENTATION=+